jgi:hypothetical protein
MNETEELAVAVIVTAAELVAMTSDLQIEALVELVEALQELPAMLSVKVTVNPVLDGICRTANNRLPAVTLEAKALVSTVPAPVLLAKVPWTNPNAIKLPD